MAASGNRYLELDALRGFAVMGILLMNIIAFSMPEMAYMNPTVYGGTQPPDMIAWLLSFLFVDGKMRGLFTLLFGASTMLVIERARQSEQNPAKVHFSRMFWLGVFGLAHFFLLWFGDILFLYAVVGCLIYFLADTSSSKLIRWGLVLYAAGFVFLSLFMGSLFYMQYLAEAAGPGSEMDLEFQKTMVEFAPSAAAVAEQVALMQSGFVAIMTDKLVNNWYSPLSFIVINIGETLPLMMIGMALYKNGFMTGQWDADLYRRWGKIGMTAGLLLLLPSLAAIWFSDFDPLITFNAVMPWTMPSRLAMTIAYAALLILLIRRCAASRLLHRIAAAGRAAFTNYLGTTILMTFLFYGWGLGLFGQIGRAEAYLFVLGAWVIMLLWSMPWLQRFRYGPLEWLWRSLARGKPQDMRLA